MSRPRRIALLLAVALGGALLSFARTGAGESGSAVPLPERMPSTLRAVTVPGPPPSGAGDLRANPPPGPDDPGRGDHGPTGAKPAGREPGPDREPQREETAEEESPSGRIARERPLPGRRPKIPAATPPPEGNGSAAAEPAPTTATPDSASAARSPLPRRSGGSLLDLAPVGAAQAPPAVAGQQAERTREPGEVVLMSADMQEAIALGRRLGASGYRLLRRRRLGALDLVMTTVRVPDGMDVTSALSSLAGAGADVLADANHRFVPQAGPAEGGWAPAMVGWTPEAARCAPGRTIGVIDSAPQLAHPALRGVPIDVRPLLGAGTRPAPPDHGTAIAALLVGRPTGSHGPGLLSGQSLVVASALRQRDDGAVDTTAELLVRAFDVLLGRGADVVNVSLGGPANRLVEAAVNVVRQHGVTVVAAAGNGGASGRPVYPAAYPGVIAVTAVDARRRLYRHATHGDYVAFAAPGVDLWVPSPGGGRFVSGTSYATPFVTALVASSAASGVEALVSAAQDLGAPGRDPGFGWGLARFGGDCPALAAD